MKPRILILGAGFGGLELSTSLSEALGDGIAITSGAPFYWRAAGLASKTDPLARAGAGLLLSLGAARPSRAETRLSGAPIRSTPPTGCEW
jgi:hypothetical protein